MTSKTKCDGQNVQIIEVETRQLQIAFEAKAAFKFTQILRFQTSKMGMNGSSLFQRFCLPWVVKADDSPFYEVYANWLPLLPDFYVESTKIRVQLHPKKELIFTQVAWEYALSLCLTCIAQEDFQEHYEEFCQSIPDSIQEKITQLRLVNK